jgi:hypothetical protein
MTVAMQRFQNFLILVVSFNLIMEWMCVFVTISHSHISLLFWFVVSVVNISTGTTEEPESTKFVKEELQRKSTWHSFSGFKVDTKT